MQSSDDVAVVCDPHSGDATAAKAFLKANGIVGAQWYTPHDVADVDKAVRAGTIHRVVFLRISDLLEAMWSGDIAADRWSAVGANVDFIESSAQTPTAYAQIAIRSWAYWRRCDRQRQAIAGAAFSALALAITFALNCLAT